MIEELVMPRKRHADVVPQSQELAEEIERLSQPLPEPVREPPQERPPRTQVRRVRFDLD